MKTLYRVKFTSGDQLYDLFVKHVYQSDMYGFIVLEEFVFGENSSVVVDPSEEKLKDEFKHVNSTHIPLHAVVRIDEVEREGVSKISELSSNSSNVTHFPSSFIVPPKKND